MSRFRPILLLVLGLSLGTSLLAVNHSAGFVAFNKIEADPTPALKAEQGWAEIVVANPRALLGKIVSADLLLDDACILVAKNGTYSTYRVKPGKHTITLLSGLVRFGTVGDEAWTKLQRGQDLKEAEKILVKGRVGGMDDRVRLAQWTNSHSPDLVVAGDLQLYRYGREKKDNVVVVERNFLNEQPVRPEGRNYRLVRRAGNTTLPQGNNVFAFLEQDVDLVPGARLYFTVVERAYVCGPILRETDAATFQEMMAKKAIKEAEPLWFIAKLRGEKTKGE
jgi:hypothetical protein